MQVKTIPPINTYASFRRKHKYPISNIKSGRHPNALKRAKYIEIAATLPLKGSSSSIKRFVFDTTLKLMDPEIWCIK